jgi:hypothetical protein
MPPGSTKIERDTASPSRLSELLECEQDLAELMAATREEGRRRVDEARADVARAEAELEASLEEESGRVRGEIGAAAQARVHELRSRARERAARYEGVSDQEVDRLAAAAFRRLLGGGEAR